METLQPGYKPSLLCIFALLGEMHAERYQRTKRNADLDEAISATRLALSISSADKSLTTILLSNLANGLWKHYQSSGHEDDLYRALNYGLQALESFTREDSHRVAILGILGAIRASLYSCRNEYHDLQDAISNTRKAIDFAIRCKRVALLILFNNLGAYLWMQYCHSGREEDLDQSVASFVKALECPTDNIVDRVTCLINCGQVLTKRYHRSCQLQDLGLALGHAKEAMQLDPSNSDLAILLKSLDQFLEHRHEFSSSVHINSSHEYANLSLESGMLLLPWLGFMLIIVTYAYYPTTEILLSIVAYPAGYLYHWMMNSRRPVGEQRTLIKDYFTLFSPNKRLPASRGDPGQFAPKILAMPLIPVPSASSLRGLQFSDVSSYSSLLYNQRRNSIQSVRSEQELKSYSSTARHGVRHKELHKRRYSGHRPGPTIRRSQKATPTIAVMTAETSPDPESPNNFSTSAALNVGPQIDVELSRDDMDRSREQREASLMTSSLLQIDHKSRSVPDSGYGSSSAGHEGRQDLKDYSNSCGILINDPNHKLISPSNGQSHFIVPHDFGASKNISPPIVSLQNPWADTSEKPDQVKIGEEVNSSLEEGELGEKDQVIMFSQGNTQLHMETNSGLVMGNLSSTRAEVVGQYIFHHPQSGVYAQRKYPGYANSRQHCSPLPYFHDEEISATSITENKKREVFLQDEEVQISAMPDRAPRFVSADALNHGTEVPVRVSTISIDGSSMHDNVPRVVELPDDNPGRDEEEGFDTDLVDQLAREYLESSALCL